MKKHLFLLLFSTLLVFPTWAKSSKKATHIIQQTIRIIEQNSIQTYFELKVKEKNGNMIQDVAGKFKMNGQKFALIMDEMEIYYDGKMQWAYLPSLGEVSITEPTQRELLETNPLALLSHYATQSTIHFSKKQQDKNSHSITLLPIQKETDFEKIIILVNKKNNHPLSIQLIHKNGIVSTLRLTQFQPKAMLKKNDFVFDEKKHKDVEINDLR